MSTPSIFAWYSAVVSHFPNLTWENFIRIILLYYGLEYNKQDSYPDHFTRIEIIYTPKKLTSTAVLTFLRPSSPFHLKDVGDKKLLFYHDDFLDTIDDYEQRPSDLRKPEPFHFYVKEVNDDVVLKLNPVQLCDFFQNPRGLLPCSFCFRNDMVQRFQNMTAAELVEKVIREETKRDNMKTLKSIDEISIVTGSYTNDRDYITEISTLISGIKPLVSPNLRVVVGSHEGKSRETYEALKQAGITVFAFPVESLDDNIRRSQMKNRKGAYPVEQMIQDIHEAIEVFGEDGVIVRLVAGMGDELNDGFMRKIKTISTFGTSQGPWWNINEYMPFTHYHWRLFEKNPPYTLDYLFEFMHRINTYVALGRQMRFKVSP